MRPGPEPVPTTRISRSPTSAHRLVAAAAVLVALALLKPWGGGPGPAPQGPAARSASAPLTGVVPAAAAPATTPAATPQPSLRADEILCPGGGPQIVWLEHLATWTVRTWVPIAPVVATGPTDSGIPTISLGRDVLALGVCTDRPVRYGPAGRQTAPTPLVGIWTLPAAARTPAPATPPPPAGLVAIESATPSRPDAAVLYRPTASPDRWPAGRYVLQLDGGGATAWVAISVGGPG